MSYPQAAEYIRQNQSGSLEYANKNHHDKTGEFLLPESERNKFLEKHPKGYLTGKNKLNHLLQVPA